MSDIEKRFEAAAAAARNLPQRPDNDTLLQLYALYKQGSAGDVSGDKPGLFDFIGLAKYEAWQQLRGLPQDEARQRYVELVERLGGAAH